MQHLRKIVIASLALCAAGWFIAMRHAVSNPLWRHCESHAAIADEDMFLSLNGTKVRTATMSADAMPSEKLRDELGYEFKLGTDPDLPLGEKMPGYYGPVISGEVEWHIKSVSADGVAWLVYISESDIATQANYFIIVWERN